MTAEEFAFRRAQAWHEAATLGPAIERFRAESDRQCWLWLLVWYTGLPLYL